ncbi:MAG: methyltransferase domain-containing protein [Gemmatimonadetes bacterium]|nr:methyltransferase domain-containing protein [Gemmatimonadota bacterium]MBT7912623.1 methyltransferase domain-containing protein [Candidatus Bathyarchaeota archaeon]
MDELIEHYTNANEDERLVRQNITKVEYDTTLHILSDYISTAEKITEFGAATGRYSLHFAKQGLQVIAVELAPDQVSILNNKAAEFDANIEIVQGDVREVSFIESGSQDAVLILGPLYHIQQAQDRHRVMHEAHRILKSGGVVAVAYISRHFVAGIFAQRFPHLVTAEVLSQLHNEGTVNSTLADRFYRVGYFSTPEEIESFVIDTGFDIADHVATDGFGRYIAQAVNAFGEDQYEVWLKYHLKICRERTLLGSSNHGLVIGRKDS